MAHIAIYLPSLRGGGAERVMVTLANSFAARGVRVDLVLAKAEGPYLDEVADGVDVVDLGAGRVSMSLMPLVRYLKHARPDAILSALNHANIIAILARRLAGVSSRLVVSERNSLASFGSGWKDRLLLWLMGYLYPMADKVIAVSNAMADELVSTLRLSPDLVAAIPNPVDIARIQALAADRPEHLWLESGQPPVVLAVGRLVPQKDYATLLEAFALVRGGRDARLIILGEGPLRAELEARAAQPDLKGAVALLGFQENPYGWMAACAVYVMSSRYEGFPNSLVQAMACNASVVSTDCPTGPDEILESGKWGRLVPVGDGRALANAMEAVLDDKSKARVADTDIRANMFCVDDVSYKYLKSMLI